MFNATLKRIRLQRFRNLREVDVDFCSGANWIVGANAAGKTALLESIYCLSRGRSFRGRRFGSLIERGETSARIEGWLEGSFGDARISWASTRGEVTRDPAQGIETRLPVRLICEWTHALVEGEPSLRRRFIDWNLMLWDRSAGGLFSRFRRVASQRNAWLRSGARGQAVWDEPYAVVLSAISRRRARFFEALAEGFRALNAEEDWFREIEARWDGAILEHDELLSRLAAMRPADQERGFTYLGISRDDFSLRLDGNKWVGSRGQSKILGCVLQLAAEQLVSVENGMGALWLVDDLDAELAPAWSQRVVSLLRRHGSQAFYTALPGKELLTSCCTADDAMFHVEHGCLLRAAD
ncbi:DNA replication/repair protein RecF [Halochromatium roseum]|uniref:DNA replication/repair protein RecF n=1 Tax=Halochromatium roseum TaxID=391920 RepID=UPI0019130457|nr:DNA replication and repair protein RecF [Halochromatium roseum]MBK5937951.1 hypothetical protein [Halochromatium roseum]